ncbi:ParB/RepB/Spo0J family partition protein [Actinoplanes sp. URMC 104]|uniref:ParB/RepB/Spo0J family partition protein n=1 Tax=Actinoplanes sp. URMC 104 TaxID=3423409 RepID=UPI003F1C6287
MSKTLPPPNTSVATNALSRRFSIDEPDERPAQRGSAAPEHPTSISPHLIAPNPFNKRRIDPGSKDIRELGDSMATGQIQASTIATRAAFLRIFPELEETIGDAQYVQLAGGRRRAAAIVKGIDLDVRVKDEFADSPERWKAATAVENLKRQDLDLIEEAESVAEVFEACGRNQSAAARELGHDQPWVAHRLNLLKLSPEAQELIRQHRLPIRELRGSLHSKAEKEQIEYLQEVLRLRGKLTAAAAEPAEPGETPKVPPVPAQRAQRPSPIDRAVARLGKTPVEVGANLAQRLDADARRVVAAALLEGLDR